MEIPDEFKYLYDHNKSVIKYPAELLRTKSESVGIVNKHVKSTIKKMRDIMMGSRGAGISAVQIGVLERIIFVRSRVLINPEIIFASEDQAVDIEGCLSIPGLWGDVSRSTAITVKARNNNGEDIIVKLKGDEAIIAQHEIDHLNGILFIDRAIPSTLKWEHPIEN